MQKNIAASLPSHDLRHDNASGTIG
jgi:hypothetical protein